MSIGLGASGDKPIKASFGFAGGSHRWQTEDAELISDLILKPLTEVRPDPGDHYRGEVTGAVSIWYANGTIDGFVLWDWDSIGYGDNASRANYLVDLSGLETKVREHYSRSIALIDNRAGSYPSLEMASGDRAIQLVETSIEPESLHVFVLFDVAPGSWIIWEEIVILKGFEDSDRAKFFNPLSHQLEVAAPTNSAPRELRAHLVISKPTGEKEAIVIYDDWQLIEKKGKFYKADLSALRDRLSRTYGDWF